MAGVIAKVGTVVIGRNEGERLKRCLNSLSFASTVIYVDSGSSDDSARWAADNGAHVIELDMSVPFTAARARNAGFRRLCEIAPEVAFVQFVDGDCEISQGWLEGALTFLISHPEIGVLSGVLRERHPDSSIYNWLCDLEWNGTVGDVHECGGIAMMRTTALLAVGAFRDELIAGEEPELCVRLRAAGWRVWRLDTNMAIHDAAMMHFSQWWKRNVRSGHAAAEGAYLHGSGPDRFRVWECRRTWLWGLLLPLICLPLTLAYWPWGLAAWLIYPLQTLRQTARNSGPLSHRVTLALYQVLGRFPEAVGQIKFIGNRVLGRRSQLIEYK
jgi:GT2 family glycosyltransferase